MINSLIVRLAQSLGSKPNSEVGEEVRDGAGDVGSLSHQVKPPLLLPTLKAGPLDCRSWCVFLPHGGRFGWKRELLELQVAVPAGRKRKSAFMNWVD